MKRFAYASIALALGLADQMSPAAAVPVETVLYSFCGQTGCADGSNPIGGLTAGAGGNIYGVTANGGVSQGAGGVVFKLLPDGSEATVYAFGSDPNKIDGIQPMAGVLELNGLLYGTTLTGGEYTNEALPGGGILFSLDPSTGVENILHSFGNVGDGFGSQTAMVNVKGVLYGALNWQSYTGTIFAFDLSGQKEKLVYTFCGQTDCVDGKYPSAGIVAVKGTLYGTTLEGGTGYGVAFGINPSSGTEKVLHSFSKNDIGGCGPDTTLLNRGNVLYGITTACGKRGYGAVFSLNRSTNAESVVSSFKSFPTNNQTIFLPGLIRVGKKFYGATVGNGTTDRGEVYSVDPDTGKMAAIYKFCSQTNCADGAAPSAKLLAINGALYGETIAGGAHGQGTVFRLTL
ncbi:MAG TPA: choice-of-anchor tandem repeat GloVer-containing protein [Rhizomicrobium sp.]|jgi:uncharacterized repeat protein (TIGR03803 family)